MKLQEIRKIAQTWGVDASKGRTKQDIIRDIQIAEGYSPCFHTKETCNDMIVCGRRIAQATNEIPRKWDGYEKTIATVTLDIFGDYE